MGVTAAANKIEARMSSADRESVPRLPLLTIGFPVRNGERHLRQALNSLLAQDFVDFELIVSDNASEDGTAAIVGEYAAHDPRIRYVRHEENGGAAWNYNWVFRRSRSRYFMWASHDDFWESSYVGSCVRLLEGAPDAVLAGSRCRSLSCVEGVEAVQFTDPGISTSGLDAAERFQRYKSWLHGGANVNSLFYGVYRLDAVRRVMPIRKVFANDHLLLAALCFEGEFLTDDGELMVKRQGGASKDYTAMARSIGLKYPWAAKFPFLIRELFLQDMIFRTRGISKRGKIRLSIWSAVNYVLVHWFRPCRKRLRKTVKALKRKTGFL